MNTKLIGIAIILVLLLASHAGLYYLGMQHCTAAVQATTIKQQAKQDKAVSQVQVEAAKREIVYIDRIKTIHDAKADCLDTDMPDALVSLLSVRPHQ